MYYEVLQTLQVLRVLQLSTTAIPPRPTLAVLVAMSSEDAAGAANFVAMSSEDAAGAAHRYKRKLYQREYRARLKTKAASAAAQGDDERPWIWRELTPQQNAAGISSGIATLLNQQTAAAASAALAALGQQPGRVFTVISLPGVQFDSVLGCLGN